MPTTLDATQLKRYFSGKHFHTGYDETVEIANRVKIHADGIFDEELIGCRRPNESEEIKEYREKIWKAITKPYVNKVLTSLNKIRRSTEWSIKFNENAFPNRVVEEERLNSYLLNVFPYFTSITNWAFGLLLREWGVDANSWILVKPVDDDIQPNEYVRPYPYIFKSEQVIDAKEDDFAVLLDAEKVVYRDGETTSYGDRYWVVTTEYIQRWDQIGTGRKFKITWEWVHGLGICPAFKFRGVVKSSYGGVFINESRLAPMMERFDEAAREYSDLQAEVVQHIHSEKWEMGTDDCSECKGRGTVKYPGFNMDEMTCPTCKGTGARKRGPYSALIVPKPMAGESQIPTPPLGYVQKSVEIVKTQDDRIDSHIWHGLAAINMEFLFEKPLNESGIAKAYDADETNNFVHSCAEDIVAMIDKVAFVINEMRYSMVVSDPHERADMLPVINVPERFDIFSAQVMEDGLSKAKQNKVNPVIVNALEIEYANKRFNTEPEVRDRLSLTLKLDPLPNISEDDKVMRLQNGGITKETYIMSSNIHEFINRALDEKGDAFYAMALKEQQSIIKAYATEQVQAASVGKQIISDVTAQ